MTYKKIVEGCIERDSDKWIGKLLDDAGIKFHWTATGNVVLEKREKPMDGFYYTCPIDITLNGYVHARVEVGGTVDDSGIYHSVVWDDKHNIIWMSVSTTRDELGITEFKLNLGV